MKEACDVSAYQSTGECPFFRAEFNFTVSSFDLYLYINSHHWSDVLQTCYITFVKFYCLNYSGDEGRKYFSREPHVGKAYPWAWPLHRMLGLAFRKFADCCRSYLKSIQETCVIVILLFHVVHSGFPFDPQHVVFLYVLPVLNTAGASCTVRLLFVRVECQRCHVLFLTLAGLQSILSFAVDSCICRLYTV